MVYLMNEFSVRPKTMNVIAENIKKALTDLDSEMKKIKSQMRAGAKISTKNLKIETTKADSPKSRKEVEELEISYLSAKNEIKNLKPKQIISERNYLDLSLKYGQVIKVGIGAEAIYELLKRIDLDREIKDIQNRLRKKTEQESKKNLKRLRTLIEFKKAGLRPEWMVLTVLPVIPPDLRPMVQLDGGGFAASDLNDLYRRGVHTPKPPHTALRA